MRSERSVSWSWTPPADSSCLRSASRSESEVFICCTACISVRLLRHRSRSVTCLHGMLIIRLNKVLTELSVLFFRSVWRWRTGRTLRSLRRTLWTLSTSTPFTSCDSWCYKKLSTSPPCPHWWALTLYYRVWSGILSSSTSSSPAVPGSRFLSRWLTCFLLGDEKEMKRLRNYIHQIRHMWSLPCLSEKMLIHNMHIVYLFYSYSYLQTYTPLSPLSASPFFLHLPPASSPSGRRGRWRSLRCVRSSWSERPDLRSWSTSSCWMWAETQ